MLIDTDKNNKPVLPNTKDILFVGSYDYYCRVFICEDEKLLKIETKLVLMTMKKFVDSYPKETFLKTSRNRCTPLKNIQDVWIRKDFIVVHSKCYMPLVIARRRVKKVLELLDKASQKIKVVRI